MILSDRKQPKSVRSTAVIFQGEIAISQNGGTSIHSPGYEGCLGVIVIPANGAGALVAHIAETGFKNRVEGQPVDPAVARPAYTSESIRLVLELATARLGAQQIEVGLFRGWRTDVQNDWGLRANPNLTFFDFRPQSFEKDAGSFTFDPTKRKIYIGDQSNDRQDAMGEVRERPTERTTLTIPSGAKAMPVLVYA